ncbi:Cathepsin E [Clonorchis sinensis]|uniref:Cathepsin E n=1 Tax=Clonorchis sinensis TaxID=79923 RepID=A0A3R7FHW1_CLOSI|nr:Cathepsin E [Clonorchis sinensis]
MLGVYNPRVNLPAFGDGHLGLGHPDVERKLTDFSILDVMSSNNMINYKRFTLFCVCSTHRNNLEPDARIVFGSHASVNPRAFHMVPLVAFRGSWKLHILSLGTPTGPISQRLLVGMLDSTSWLSKLSVAHAETVNTGLGAQKSGNLYVVDCNRMDQMPILRIALDGAQFDLHPRAYIQQDVVEGRMRCFSSIVPDPAVKSGGMILGMTFMEHFIITFDQQQRKMGFQQRVC